MTNKKLSIIVPVYNVEKYLSTFLNSILHQLLNSYELILIDDGSSDQSGKICDDFAKKNSNIFVIHKENEGVSIARNIGIYYSQGKYLCFLDSDDIVKENYFSEMLSLFNIANVDMVSCLYSTELYPYSSSFSRKKVTVENSKIMMHKLLNDKNNLKYGGYLWCKVFKASIIKNKKIIFNENVKMWEDVLFVEEYLCNCRKIAFLNKDLYFYRKRQGSITNLGINKLDIIDSMKIVWENLFRMKKLPTGVKLFAYFAYLKNNLAKMKYLMENRWE